MPAAPSPLLPALLLLLSLPLWFGGLALRDAAQAITGPLAVAVDGDRVAVAAPGVLYRLDGNGRLQQVYDDIIDPQATDAGLAWLGEDLLASPGRDGTLLRCDSAGKCSAFSADPWAPRGPVQALVESPRVIWFTETDGDRIQRFRPDGRRLDTPLSELLRPGGIAHAGDALLVCNTGAGSIDRHPLHRHGVDHGTFFARHVEGEGGQAIDRPLRIAAAGGDGYRVLFSNATRSRGLLAMLSADGEVRPLAVPGLVNPVALAPLPGGDWLLVDEDRMQLLRVGGDGSASVFGDADFNAQLAGERGLRDALRLAWPALLVLAALAATAGGSWLLLQRQRRRGDPPRPLRRGADGVDWLVTTRELAGERTRASLLLAAPAAIVPALAAGWFGFGAAGAGWCAAVLLVAAAVPLLAAWRATAPQGLQVGLRGPLLVVADAEHGLREIPLVKVARDDRQLQPEGGAAVALGRDGIDWFHRPTLEAHFFPRLPERPPAGPAAAGNRPGSPS